MKPEKIVHGLSENELNYLGDRLGYKVENLGMSDYRFTRGSTTFGVTAHNDLGTRQTLADEPVTLGYSLPGAKRPLEMQIPVAQGITLKVLETDFRGFIQKIEVTQKRG